MANLQRIGFYLTDDKIVLVDSDPKKQQRVISSTITSSLTPTQEVPLHTEITEEIHTVGTLQRLLRENKIEPGGVCVSIPSKDVSVRSFVVPAMPPSELNNVVYFEAKKYVPFELRLMDYVFQAIPFVENKQKRLRIVFYAVRKQVLEKYDRILKQAGCKAVLYEASLVSLAKQLISKGQLKLDQKTVVIYSDDNYGQIVFYEKGISYFVREFPLTVSEVHDPKAVGDVLRANLLREIRKSFGYYTRQISQEKIKEILILTNTPDKELMKTLTDELSVKVRAVDPTVTTVLQTTKGMEALCAAGACVVKAPSNFSVFNFLLARSAPQMSESGRVETSPFGQLFTWNEGDFVYAIRAAIICTIILTGAYIFGRMNLSDTQNKNNLMLKDQGVLASKTIGEIKDDIKRSQAVLDNYNKVFGDHSHMSSMLISLTKALPSGTWFDSVSIRYTGKSVFVDLKGNIYLKYDKGSDYQIMNGFLNRLRADKYLSSIDFKLNSVQKIKKNNQEFSIFSITGV